MRSKLLDSKFIFYLDLSQRSSTETFPFLQNIELNADYMVYETIWDYARESISLGVDQF